MSRFAADNDAGHDMPSFGKFDAGNPPPSHFVDLGKVACRDGEMILAERPLLHATKSTWAASRPNTRQASKRLVFANT